MSYMGHVVIYCDVSMMLYHLIISRKIHLSQVLHTIGYLDKHRNTDMLFDPADPYIDFSQFEQPD